MDVLDLMDEIGSIAGMLFSTYWIVLVAIGLGAYLFVGYMYMCIGKKAGIDGDWRPFIPIARQLYMMEIVDRPWWNIFLFKESGTLVLVISCLASWILVTLTKSLMITVIVLLTYFSAVLVFSFLYYRDFYAKFRFNPNTAWLEIIPGSGYVSVVFKMLIGFSDVVAKGECETGTDKASVIPRVPAAVNGVDGQYAGTSFDISDGSEVVLGRDVSKCHIIFDQFQTDISRLHCKIRYDTNTDNYYVTNMSTSSGTFMENGTRLEVGVARPVVRGTMIYLASKKNSFRLE